MSSKLYSETVTDLVGNTYMRTKLVLDDGTVMEKDLTMEQYFSVLGEASILKVKAEKIPVGELPANFIDGNLTTDPGTFDVALFVPGQKRAVLYCGRHFRIPFPDMVFVFQVRNGAVFESYCACCDGEGPDAKMYRYPFGNVSTGDHICFGNVAGRVHKNMTDLEEKIEDFFQSETNDDYFDMKNAVAYSQGEMLKKAEKKEEIPLSWLTPVTGSGGKQMRMHEFVARHLERKY